MARQNKDAAPAKRWRLVLVDDTSHETLWLMARRRSRFIFDIVLAVLVFAVVFFCIVAYTPVRTLIPGYPDAYSRRMAVKTAIQADSLQRAISRWELYSENLLRVLEGRDPLRIDSILTLSAQTALTEAEKDRLRSSDSLLRAQVDEAEQFELTGRTRTLPIEGLHFFVPLKGVVSASFVKLVHPYIDISAPANSVVASALDGSVISAHWSDEDGYVLVIQHPNDIVTIYKHNMKLLVRTGDSVTGGTPVALVGSTGSLATDDHLHFELWYKGMAVDPVEYINF